MSVIRSVQPFRLVWSEWCLTQYIGDECYREGMEEGNPVQDVEYTAISVLSLGSPSLTLNMTKNGAAYINIKYSFSFAFTLQVSLKNRVIHAWLRC